MNGELAGLQAGRMVADTLLWLVPLLLVTFLVWRQRQRRRLRTPKPDA